MSKASCGLPENAYNVSTDEGKHWNNVELPMLSDTYSKRVRPNPKAPGLIVALHDRGVVFLDW